MKILIVGYGNIGRHVYKELNKLQPDIFDKYKTEENNYDPSLVYDFAFICVDTPMNIDGSCNVVEVEEAIKSIKSKIYVIKSTIPPKTTERLIKQFNKKIVFSPENYGTTQHCDNDIEYLILGGEKNLTIQVAQLYQLVKNGYFHFYFTDSTTAELSKYMLNSYLALKVTFCNEFNRLAERIKVNYEELRELFIADRRIEKSHTIVYKHQRFYDSHCLNKDIPGILTYAREENLRMPLLEMMSQVNKIERRKTTRKRI